MTDCKERIVYFDFLRVISILAVIFIHTAAIDWSVADIHSFEWNVFNFYDSMVRWSVPVFIMISGALFLSPAKSIPLKKIYTKYIPRIVSVYVVWSLFYVMVECFRGTCGANNFIKMFIKGHYHMWFLLTLIGLYVIVPLLRPLTTKIETTKYYLSAAFVFSFVIPTVVLGMQFIDAVYGTESAKMVQHIQKWLTINFSAGFSFYFVLGYYLNVTEISKNKEKACYILGLLGFISTIVLTRQYSLFLNRPTEAFYYAFNINVMLESICVFVYCKNRLPRLCSREPINRAVRYLSQLSFGVYLIHPFFLTLIHDAGLKPSFCNPIISVAVISFAVFVLSNCTSAVLNKVPGVKKFVG